MTNFVLAYRGGAMAETPEAQEKAMAEWGAWFGGLGGALVDGGNPFAASRIDVMLFSAALIVLFNIIVDATYAFIDPRVRLS